MAKKIILTLLISASVFSVLHFGTSTIGISSNPTNQVKAESTSPLYTVRTYGNIIGVFHYGEDVPFRLLSVSADSLPEADVESLKVGIPLYSDADLFNIIEDLDS